MASILKFTALILIIYISISPAPYTSELNETSSPFRNQEETPVGLTPIKTDTFEMVFVDAGNFQMGNDSGNFDEKPIHRIRVNAFYLGKYEITQIQWRNLMGYNPSHFADCDSCPVENVSWNESMEFIVKLNTRTGHRYRLPTEAEWEFAARGGMNSRRYKYSGSNDINEAGWYEMNSSRRTHPVGQKKPNELDLFDMSGNVSEWCSDWYDPDFFTKSPGENPSGPAQPVEPRARVLRGGSWGGPAPYCRVSFRFDVPPVDKFNGLGFRIASDNR